jgi:D-3-phosphoglycerate dehydrogenase
LVVNTARAGLVDKEALIAALDKKQICGYVADVMWEEPIQADEPLLKHNNVFITPHIGSRTYESVVRQGSAAVSNLIKMLNS